MSRAAAGRRATLNEQCEVRVRVHVSAHPPTPNQFNSSPCSPSDVSL